MSVPRRVPYRLLPAVLAALLLAFLSLASVQASGAPPAATFTANVRPDTAQPNGGTGLQNEPQVAVDQTGRTYVDWQSNNGLPSATASTVDGLNFTYLGNDDTTNTGFSADVDMATTSWPAVGMHTPSVSGSGDNGEFAGHLTMGNCGAIEIRDSWSLDQGNHWNPVDASCAPAQVDRPWIAAFTPPTLRGTTGAAAHTEVFNEYHDFASSEIFVTRSFDGGHTWDPVQYPAINPTSVEHATTFCNSIPSGIAVDQRGAHPGRVYVIWETADQPNNAAQGCDISQAEAFDHVFLSYSDDIGNPATTTPSWTSVAVFNDPCAPNPPAPPTSPTSCQDVSELFNALAVDDAGNVYVAYVRRDLSQATPEYDIYVANSSDGGNTFTTHHVPDGGTHYEPWLAAGGNGGVDLVFYRTTTIEGVGALNKPAGAPATAVWDVFLAQSLDAGSTWTVNKVSDAADSSGGIYFGDICTTGIFCSATPPGSGWGADRTLYDDFGVAIGPDGGARVIWTDARSSHTGACVTGGTVSCQTTHVMFACQTSGVGLHGETVTGCGQSIAAVQPSAGTASTPVPMVGARSLLTLGGLLLSGGVLILSAASAAVRRRHRGRPQ